MITCARCQSQDVRFGLQINQSGAEVVIARCLNCGESPQPKVTFYKKSLFDTSQLPVLVDYREYAEPCAVCQQRAGAEYHHIAPRHLFGDDCEKWPGIWLCRPHHKEWHDKVTPEMSRRT